VQLISMLIFSAVQMCFGFSVYCMAKFIAPFVLTLMK